MVETDYPPHPSGTLVDTVYDVIRKEIVTSHLESGEKLSSRVLVGRYQVSETPIEQALNRLITEGLVGNIPRKGMRVRMISWAEVDEALELRLTLDLFFVSDTIKNLWENPELTEQLNNAILHQTACLDLTEDADYYGRTYELDNRLHELHIVSSGNSKASEVFHNLNSRVHSSLIYGRQPEEQTLESIRKHQNVLGTLVNGDEGRARELITIHISNTRNHIYVALKHNNQLRQVYEKREYR